jgi:hypothetical protein
MKTTFEILSEINGLMPVPMFYFYGSPLDIMQQVKRYSHDQQKYPAIIVFDNFREIKPDNVLSKIERIAELTLYFMDRADAGAWKAAEHIEYAVKPMAEKAEAFLEARKRHRGVMRPVDVSTNMITNWGLQVEADGKKKSLFPDFLSGIILEMRLPVLK